MKNMPPGRISCNPYKISTFIYKLVLFSYNAQLNEDSYVSSKGLK